MVSGESVLEGEDDDADVDDDDKKDEDSIESDAMIKVHFSYCLFV